MEATRRKITGELAQRLSGGEEGEGEERQSGGAVEVIGGEDVCNLKVTR